MSQTPRFQAELLIQMDCLLGEGPRWDPSDPSLIFIDVLPGLQHQIGRAHV